MDDFFSEKQKEKGFLMHKSIVVFTFIIGMVSSALAVDRNSCDDYRGTKCYYNGDIGSRLCI